MSPVLVAAVLGMTVIGVGAFVGSVYTAVTVKADYRATAALVRAMTDPSMMWVDGLLVKRGFEGQLRNAESRHTFRFKPPVSHENVDSVV